MPAVVLSNSRRNKVTGCKYRFYLENILGLRREQDEMPLRLGTLWHAYLARALQDGVWDATGILDAQDASSDPEIGAMVAGMARTVAPRFQRFLADYEVVAVERPFFLRITRSPRSSLGFRVRAIEASEIEPLLQNRGFSVVYTGVIDAVLRDRRTGHLWVMEHKTTSAAEQSRFERAMDASFQVYGYMLAAQTLFPNDEVRGILFDAARKKLPATPKLNQCQFCKEGWQTTKIKDAGATVAIRTICPVCDGSGKGRFSSTIIETTEEAIDEALTHAPHLLKLEYDEWRNTAFREWRAECLRSSRPFWFVYPKPIRPEQIRFWLEDTWQVARQYTALRRLKSESDFCRHLDAVACDRCPMRPLCLDGTDWDRESAPVGYVKRPPQEIPEEVLKPQNEVQEATEVEFDNDFIGF